MFNVFPLLVGLLILCCFWMGIAIWGIDRRCKELERRLDRELFWQKYENEKQLTEFSEKIAAYHKKRTCENTAPKV